MASLNAVRDEIPAGERFEDPRGLRGDETPEGREVVRLEVGFPYLHRRTRIPEWR